MREMHEWPLVVFTALAIPGAGVFAARLLAELVHLAPAHTDLVLAAATIALFTGLVASLAHLGRPLRAPLAVRRAGRNALSTEIALALALLLVALLALLPATPPARRGAFDDAAGVLALGLLATLGLVYFLPARWPWHSTLVATPTCAGLAVGTVSLACAGNPQIVPIALVALLADGAIFALPWTARVAAPGRTVPCRRVPLVAPDHPAIFARRQALVALRILLVDLGPAAFLLARFPLAAVITILAGVLVDRFTFYGMAAGRSTESQIARVEAVIGGDDA
jgi:DMSO reductase anchor subunit